MKLGKRSTLNTKARDLARLELGPFPLSPCQKLNSLGLPILSWGTQQKGMTVVTKPPVGGVEWRTSPQRSLGPGPGLCPPAAPMRSPARFVESRDRCGASQPRTPSCCICIYIYIHINTYIYIYAYTESGGKKHEKQIQYPPPLFPCGEINKYKP